jgi:competence ComEA-like helix-hairpin-helix protein
MERTKESRVSKGSRRTAWRVAVAALLLSAVVGGVAIAAEEPGRVDLNTATAAELETLPGVGPAKAQAIVAHRDVAPFKNADELVEVKGIGEKLYAQLKDRVTVSAAPAGRKPAGDAAAGAAASGNRGAPAAAKP